MTSNSFDYQQTAALLSVVVRLIHDIQHLRETIEFYELNLLDRGEVDAGPNTTIPHIRALCSGECLQSSDSCQ